MNFKPELVEKILAGQKTQTRRVVSDNPRSPWYAGLCSLKLARSYAVCPGRGKNAVARVVVHGIWKERAGQISNFDAMREGFTGRADFIAYWERLHGSFDPSAQVWVISFELLTETADA